MKSEKDNKDKRKAKPVFFDPTSHRLVLFSILSVVFLVFVVVWFVSFMVHLYGSALPPQAGRPVSPGTEVSDAAGSPDLSEGEDAATSQLWTEALEGAVPQDALYLVQDVKVHAFVPSWSMAGYVEAKTHIDAIDVLMSDWVMIDGATGTVTNDATPQRDKLQELWNLNKTRVSFFPVAQIELAQGASQPNVFSSVAMQTDLVAALTSLAVSESANGLCVDLSGATNVAVQDWAGFATALRAGLNEAGKDSCVIAGVEHALWAEPNAADLADKLIVLAFNEPGPFSGPQPLAPQEWFETQVSQLMEDLPAEKVVIALGGFGMDWISARSAPEYLNYFDVMETAERHNVTLRMDQDALNTELRFLDDEGQRHHIWLLDALSAQNQLSRLPINDLDGIALWPVSGGDPGVWKVLAPGVPDPRVALGLLQRIDAAPYVRYVGKGPFLTGHNPATPGRRILQLDHESGLITEATYLDFPRAFTVTQSGDMPERSVILTFDDGPSARYTPAILDVLKEYDVPAVFFVVGTRVQQQPEIVRRIVDEGHELGVHTFFHPNIAEISDIRLRLELHASQELIESVSGTGTNLFRAPYGFDENPETPNEARVLSLLSDENYVVVGIEIDSTDWTRPGAEQIAETVTARATADHGNVVLLHDAGGDREQTVEALPMIIQSLKDAGISIVSIADVAGHDSRLQPARLVDENDQMSGLSFLLIRSLKTAVTTAFFVLITAGVFRSLTVLVLALIKERRVHKGGDPVLPVSVLIPAFCEETVIVKSVTSVLQSDYPIAQVIVIDDGSTDDTAQVVRDQFSADPRVRLIRQDNQGKAEALNTGIRHIDTPVFVAIDADTIIAPEAVGELVKHFNDPGVGAVAGNVKVGNRQNLLTRLQAIEYITAQNLDRRAYEILNGIMVVPGSIGAWRTEAVIAAGGYMTQTLVEDADLTVSVIRSDFKVVFEPAAHAYTEAPETIRQWMRQRLRWHFGMLQIAWKHKGAFFERRAVGLVSIPDLFLFGAVFSLFAPIADLVMIFNLVALVDLFSDSSRAALQSSSILVAIGYVAYLLSDLVLATIAFGLEPKEDKRLLPWVLTQRFFYRQIYWMVALRSIARAVTGRFTGWRKITRTSSIDLNSALELSRAQARVVDVDKVTDDPSGQA
ncbi:polysaccharide deacetylase family protein [uncultured Aliiroseovarius sp.]|uniref:polysaccharide deacetylase family protein n=1 Tax=uncultured Aliiroseovarius sp. TaxID=1658783 RepID=UPI0026392C8E|nr:polysaccharide deacetylase family protein [uncultured Aliiroseovarius sp.]